MRQNGLDHLTKLDGGFTMHINILGIDIAKNVFQLHGIDKSGKAILKKRLNRHKLMPFIATLNPCLIVMEACSGANYWYRQFIKLGHSVKLISPQYVKPFVKTNKNDVNDAQAICEAASRPSMYFVPAKAIEQQDIQSLHRVRERLITQRTALANQIRGLLAEYGIIVAKGLWQLRKRMPEILEDAENELTVRARELFFELNEEFRELDKKIETCNVKLEVIFNNNEVCKKLAEIEGISVISATALVSAIGDPSVFKNGRQVSAWLGLTPRQHSSGNKEMLLGITKRGDCYLRKLLVHGSRSVVYRAKNKTDRKSLWINSVALRRGTNKASVAVANKNVRIVWAMMSQERRYQKTIIA